MDPIESNGLLVDERIWEEDSRVYILDTFAISSASSKHG